MSKNTEITVIGGGAIGCAVAYYLSKEGAKVTLIEAGDIAEGTSSKCDGNILVSDKTPGFDCILAKKSVDLFPKLIEELDYPIEWTQRGSLILLENEKEMEVGKKFCEDMRACDISMRVLDREQLYRDEPLLARDLAGGLETDCDGSLNPMGLCYGLALGAKKLGADIKLHTRVEAIDKSGDGFIISTSSGNIGTDIIVNCGGIWAPEIGVMVGISIPIQARQGQILVSEQTFQVGHRKIYEFGYLMAKFQSSKYKRDISKRVEDNGVAFVFERTESNNFLIGSSRRFVGRDTAADIEVMQALAERAIRFFPILKDIKVVRAYAGLRPYTPDHIPIISDTHIPGYYIAAGHEGDGIGLVPITGQIITDMISGRKPFMDLSPLKYSRFLQNENEGGIQN